MSSLLEFFKEKKTRLFWSGEFFIQDCLIPSNRSITVCDGTFLFGFLWLGLFYAYWSISQKSVKGVVIQALFIMGGNSKNSDEIREKSTRAILVTQAVNDLGYSILASVQKVEARILPRTRAQGCSHQGAQNRLYRYSLLNNENNCF